MEIMRKLERLSSKPYFPILYSKTLEDMNKKEEEKKVYMP
jgi:hypothetical protein